jgi:cold-inducible RNA-binding protein
MQTKVFVSNLHQSSTLTSVRECFRACGEVSDVEFVAERNDYRAPSSAYVTMASPDAADRAVRALNGTVLDGRLLAVSVVPQNDGTRRKPPVSAPKAVIAQQYRERDGMAYELDCVGVRLTLRFAFADGGATRRVEGRINQPGSVSVEAVASTRELALAALVENWRRQPMNAATPELDWVAVLAALKDVRALKD